MKKRNLRQESLRALLTALVLPSLILAALFIARASFAGNDDDADSKSQQSLSPLDDPNFPQEFDIRAIHGTPRGTDLPVPGLASPLPTQLKALNALRNALGLAANDPRLRVDYNGLTATPRHIVNQGGFLSAPSGLPPEQIALDFISKNRGIFRFSDSDLNNLKLYSRAVSANGTTTLVYGQRLNGMTVYHGDVMVNVAKNGQIMNVGGENYPQMTLANSVEISASQAIQNAATALNVNGFTPVSQGNTQVLTTYGNLTPEYVTGEKFSRGSSFGDDIVVTQVIFPMGATGRLAYKFVLTTPQYYGIMWQHFVDAQTGETLRRSSLTAFQKKHKPVGNSFGTPGGGNGLGRIGTFRPDVQNFVEAMNNAGTSQGKTVDGLPTMLSGYRGFGRSTRTGTDPSNYVYTAPTYAANSGILSSTAGRGFRYGQMFGRIEFPLPWNNDPVRPTFTHAQLPGLMGVVTRGFPDAANPSFGSPFGWFYLPTDSGGGEIANGNANRTTTRDNGYTMDSTAVTKNQAFPGNSPIGDGTQPFSADLTPLGSSVALPDGRTLSSVYQSRYTEGNNVLTADDRISDNESTHGIKGYSLNRQFTASYFDYVASYEYGGVNAAAGVFPTSTDPDVPPATVALFYYNNVLHDYLYEIGFTEQFWNFQMDNFGKGGAGGDNVSTQVMDGSGINNANMGTPAEGGSPRMQMFLFTEDVFKRADGDFDFDVVAHELYHGVSNRSAGKGGTGCLGVTLVGEAGGMGEGWSDAIAASMSDDDVAGDFVTGQLDIGIRRLPMTNYRWSYGALDNRTLDVRRTDPAVSTVPDPQNPGSTSNPFAVHSIGEVWSATLWDMRELLIMKQNVGGSFPGVFFDGTRRLGGGSNFFVGYNQLQSVDTFHPINYRPTFNTTIPATPPNTVPVANVLPEHFVRPGLIAAENAANPNRNGPLATVVSRAGRLADQLVLRGLQLSPCNPSFVEMRDSILAADREITGGENQAVIWRAFASHGVGAAARSTGGTGGTDPSGGAQSAPTVTEDFTVPAGVTACETLGPLAAPAFTLANNTANTVTVTITAVPSATNYIVARSTSPNGPFATVGTTSTTTFTDNENGNGLALNQTYYYQVHAARNAECVGTANTANVTINTGVAPVVSPVFFGLGSVSDPRTGTSLTLSWTPATSANPNASIVYDIYRVNSISSGNGQTDSTTAPTFTPTIANRIANGISGNCSSSCSFTDADRTTGQIYYYIVQARDTENNRLDTNNTGNRIAKLSAPTSSTASSTAFAIENFETGSANARFTPALVDSANPDATTPVWQRAANSDLLVEQLAATTAMYAPDLDPTSDGTGAPSDFNTVIGPLNLTSTSVLEFDSRHATEFAFDGGVVELTLGAPGATTVFPDNAATFDLNYFLIENAYSGKLDGTLAGPVILSALQGRYSFTGTRGTSHVRAALGSFAPGGALNPGSAPVYLRFRMTSDAGTSPGAGSGWYIDNLVVNNFAPVVNVSIAGTITKNGSPLSGVSVALSGSSTATTTTNASGQYSFGGLASGGNYLVTPSLAGNTFEPNQRSYSDVQSDVTNADFIGFDSGTVPRTLTVVNSFATPGQPVTVPIVLASQGNEEAFGFSLSYNAALLSNPQVACGSDAPGCVITTNTGTPGAIGIVIDNVSFAAGTRQLATVTFDTTANPPNTASNTPVGFTNSPTPRSMSNGNGDLLSAGYVDGLVIFAQNLECDVAGRFTGDGDVLTNDITLMRQFTARNITTNPSFNEFQRADCSPRGTSGDAQILSNDLIQTRRDAARNDALRTAAGPDQASSPFVEQMLETKGLSVLDPVLADPIVRVTNRDSSRSATVVLPIEVDVSSDVVAFGFSIEFDRTRLTYQSTALGNGVPAGSVLTLNTSRVNAPSTAKLGIVVDSGTQFAAGTRQLVTVTFTVANDAPYGTTPVVVSGDPTPRSTSDSNANLVTTTYTNGGVNIAPPSSANVAISGRVLTGSGTGVPSAIVQLTSQDGTVVTVRSNSFGYFRFDEVGVGRTYVVNVSSKQHAFQPRTVTVSDEITDLDFVADEQGKP